MIIIRSSKIDTIVSLQEIKKTKEKNEIMSSPVFSLSTSASVFSPACLPYSAFFCFLNFTTINKYANIIQTTTLKITKKITAIFADGERDSAKAEDTPAAVRIYLFDGLDVG